MKKKLTIIFLLLSIIPHLSYASEESMQDLRNALTQTKYLSADSDSEQQELYILSIRILLDPAYLNVSATDRKAIDALDTQFKQLHTKIGKTFVPIFSPENMQTIKQLIAEALKTINSTKINKTGGVLYKNRIQTLIKTLMSIASSQNATENQIKYQWIKPFYLDNQFLTTDLKKKLFDVFNNDNYQKWFAASKRMLLKTNDILSDLVTIQPAAPAPTPSSEQSSEKPVPAEQITETLTLSADAKKRLQTAEQRKLPPIPKTAPAVEKPVEKAAQPVTEKPIEKAVTESIETPKTEEPVETPKEETPPAEAPKAEPTPSTTSESPAPVAPDATASADTKKIGTQLLQQALVAPVATIQTIVAKVPAAEKYAVLQVTDDAGYTAIHAAASLARADVLAVLLKDITPQQKYEILMMREKDGQTPLHLASSAKSAPTKGFKPLVAVEELLKGLSAEQKKEISTIKDNEGSTAMDIAQGINKSVAELLKRAM
jgi:outer membrane biosynthesis protein TonB